MPAEKILIVEDDPVVVRFMKSSLEQMGHHVAAAVASGEEAVDAAGKFRPDLVLMDVELQGAMDGVEAARLIRSEFGIPAIFVTGNESESVIERTRVAEPLGFIPKPFTRASLQGAIETSLSSHRAVHSRTKDAIRAAELNYRNLFENMIHGVFRINRFGKFVAANPAFAKMLGYSSPEELLEFAPEAKQHFASPAWFDELLAMLKGRQFVRDFEFQAYRRDGSKIWLAQNTRYFQGSNKDEAYFEGVVQDITERKNAEDKLRTLLERQNAILAAVPDIVMEVDADKVYTWANEAGLDFFGEDVIGKEAAFYFEGDRDTYSAVRPLFEGDENLVYVESWQRRKDGQKRLLAWRCHVLKDAEGKVIGALSSARDITDSKLEEMARLKSLSRQVLLNQLQRDLLGSGTLMQKLKIITQGMVDIFEAGFCCIWLIGPGDLCDLGCKHAAVREGPHACRNKNKCLHLAASSHRYMQTDGSDLERVPLGACKIGRIASGEERIFLSNNIAGEPDICDGDCTKKLGLASFAGFQLRPPGGENLGVLALFGAHAISSDEQAQMEALSATTAQVILAAQADEALRQSEERFRLITETMDEVFWMTDVVADKILYISPAFDSIWGYARNEMYNDHAVFEQAIHPDDFERTMEGFRLQRTGQPFSIEYRIVRPDGSIRQIWDRGFPIQDEDGHARTYVGVAQDVTDWRNAEKALKESKDYLDAIINCIPDPVFVKDRQLRFVLVNDAMCAFTGMPRDQFLGRTVLESLPVEQAHLITEQEESVFKSGKECIVEEEINVARNDKRIVMVRKALLTNKDGQKQLVGVIRDITDMKRAEEQRQQLQLQLQQAQKLEAIGQLAAGIAHEINTPTQYVGDNTRFLQDALADLTKALKHYDRLLQASRKGNADPALVAEVEKAVAEADIGYLTEEIPKAVSQSLEGLGRITSIVRAMKEFSHPGSDEKQAVDLNHAIQNTVTVCRNEWKYVAEVVLDLDETLPPVPCLPGDINQVILNLVVNAAHAISDVAKRGEKGKGTIRVATRRDGNWAKISVSDTGTGIPEKNRSKIFTPFFTTKEVGKGTGQGLAICHSVVVGKHRGTIEFETEVGKGTTFVVRLPLEPH